MQYGSSKLNDDDDDDMMKYNNNSASNGIKVHRTPPMYTG